jgi:MFS transporter, Spinster family, sphingosine-1-phosphate transporter
VLHTQDDGGPQPGPAGASLPKWATLTFVVLFAMNLLDYTDRWILSAVLPHLKAEFQIDYTHAGLLFTLFLVSYSLVSPVMGWLGDRWRRTWLLGIGVGVWSLATVGTGLADSFGHLVLARTFLGIGEATYGVLAPTILMDLYPRARRARVMSSFYLAMPIGGALGLSLGEGISNAPGLGWRWAFFIVGAPGLLAAFTALLLPEPIRGLSEGIDPERLRAHEKAGASWADYRDLMVNSSYTYAVFGMAAYTFAIGGLGALFPTFLINAKGVEEHAKLTVLGLHVGPIMLLSVCTALAAIVGMSAGGWLADRLARYSPRALFVVPGLAMLASVPFILVALYAKSLPWIYGGIFLAEALMFINTGPCNAVIANVIAPNMRAAAYALAVFAIHFLGDIWSPTLMGWTADTFGQKDTMQTMFGQLLAALGAVPIAQKNAPPANLLAGMLVVVPALLISGIVLLAGARHLPREMALMLARLKATPTATVAEL